MTPDLPDFSGLGAPSADFDRLVAAIEAVLELTRDSSGDDLYPSIDITVGEVREAITRELTKGEGGDGRS